MAKKKSITKDNINETSVNQPTLKEKEGAESIDNTVNPQELLHVLTKISNSYSPKNVIIRSLTTGLFTAAGATIGFALLLLILSRLYTGLANVPIVNDFMESTGLDKVVDYVLQQPGSNDN